MRLLAPLGLAWLLLVPVLILLYLRRRARDHRAVSNLFLWQAAVDRAHVRPRLNRLVTNLQLLLQIAFVAAGTLALAGPVMSCGGGMRVALVIDASASMQARHDGRSRFEDARAAALARVAGLRGTDAAAVIAAGGTTLLAQPLTTDGARLRRAIAEIAPGGGAADLEAAVALAWTALDPPPDRVIVFTDVSARMPPAAGAGATEVVRTGRSADNAAITALALRRHPGSRFDGQAFAAVANFGAAAVRAPFRLVQGDRVLRSELLEIPAGGRRVVVADTDDVGTGVAARLDAADALQIDNQAAVPAPASPARVAIAGPISPYVRAALAADPLVSIVPSVADADVVVCERCDAAAIEAPLLLLQRGAARASRLAIADPDHPLLAFAVFDDVVAPASAIQGASHERTLVTADGAPVVTASEHNGRRVVRAGLDVHAAPLAASAAFPIFIANAVEWLRGDAPAGGGAAIPARESDLRIVEADAPLVEPVGMDPRRASDVRLWRLPVVLAMAILALLSMRVAAAATPLRLAAGLLLAGSLAGLQVAAGPARRHVVFVLDASASIAGDARDRAVRTIASFVAGAAPGAEASLVTFGARPLVDARRVRRLPSPSPVDAGASDIGAALRLARTLASPGDRIVLLSDGNATTGDARAEARQIAAAGAAVDVVLPDPNGAARPDVLVSRVHAAASPGVRQPFDIAADVSATVPQAATVRLLRSGTLIAEEEIQIGRETRRVTFAQRADAGGTLRYDVEVAGGRDAIAANNRGSAIVTVRGPARVLYVSARPDPHGASLLAGSGFDLERRGAAALPRSAAGLDGFDAVVLDDVPADAVDAAQRDAITRYVEERGGGLAVTGLRGFGPGGWQRSRIEELLPVDMRPPGRRDASESALVLVLDKSGSMAEPENGARKIDVAIRAAAPLVDLFAASRTIGVLAFDTAVVPLVRLGGEENAPAMLDRMRALAAGGGTEIAPAVRTAREWLQASAARRRHIVLLSDGRSSGADRAALLEMASAGGTTISTVGTGSAVDRGTLEAIASRSGGRAYFPGTLAQLPDIFMQEAALAASAWRVEERFSPQAAADHPVLRQVDVGALGAVGGYVATTAKPLASVILASHRRDPLLAGWTRGLGRTVALTTDLQAAWTDAVRASPAFAQVWAQALRWAARPRDTGRLRPAIDARGTAVTIAADAFTREAGFVNGLDVRAAVLVDGAGAREVALSQTASGRYEAEPVELPPGFHTIRIDAAGRGTESAVVTGVNVTAAPEYARPDPDEALLRDVARLSGGAMLQDGESPFARAAPTRQTIDTHPWLIGLALLIFVLDVAITRGAVRRPGRRAVLEAAA